MLKGRKVVLTELRKIVTSVYKALKLSFTACQDAQVCMKNVWLSITAVDHPHPVWPRCV